MKMENNQAPNTLADPRAFPRSQPVHPDSGFKMPGYWVWCGSPIQDPQGRYHLFASRWPRRLPFYNGYAAYSEIVRASSESPTGPYRFEEVVLGSRDPEAWDGLHAHNPTVHRIGDRYLLFYSGMTFPAGRPSDHALREQPPGSFEHTPPAIGVAEAPHPCGPWTRPDRPIVSARQGHWDRDLITNPAACTTPDGFTRVYYRSYGAQIGVAEAEQPLGPYRRLGKGPLQAFVAPRLIEDPYVWHSRDRYHMIAKDLTADGSITGEKHAGLHASSVDGLDWRLSSPPLAYSRTLHWLDGRTTVQGSLERPQLLFHAGRPTHLFCATGDGPGGFDRCKQTWTIAIPLDETQPKIKTQPAALPESR